MTHVAMGIGYKVVIRLRSSMVRGLRLTQDEHQGILPDTVAQQMFSADGVLSRLMNL